MARINEVKKSRKEHACGRCGEAIPIGESYRYVEPRYGPMKIRCMKYACRFRPTDLSDSKIARIEEAIEDARDSLGALNTCDEIGSALMAVADIAREVSDEYQEASDNWAGGNGNDEFTEKADSCASFADELESWEYSGEADEDAVRENFAAEFEEREENESEEEYRERLETGADEEWDGVLEEMRNEAESALDNFSV